MSLIEDKNSIEYVNLDDIFGSIEPSYFPSPSPSPEPSPSPSPSPDTSTPSPGSSPGPSPGPVPGPLPLSDPYPEHWESVECNLYDILWSDGTVTSEIRPVSDGVTPIGLCVIPTNWLDEGEMARFVSLKYMSSVTPESGGLTEEQMLCGAGYDKDDASVLPFDNPEDDPLKKYYIPYAANYNNADEYRATYYWKDEPSFRSDIKDLRDRDNWIDTLNYCKSRPGVYAIGDINGKQNMINICVSGNYYDGQWPYEQYKDMKPCVTKYAPGGMQAGYWYVPANGELLQFAFRLRSDQNSPSINSKLAEIANVYPKDCVAKFTDGWNTNYWSSTIHDSRYVWNSWVQESGVGLSNFKRGYDTCLVVAFLLR